MKGNKVKITAPMTSLLLMFVAVTSAEQYLRCFESPMDKKLCDNSSRIRVVNAFYLDNGRVYNCDQHSDPTDMCRVHISSVNSEYYNEILEKCDGKQSCQGLQAGKAKTTCNGYVWNRGADYVLLEYNCDIYIEEEVTSSANPTNDTKGNPIAPQTGSTNSEEEVTSSANLTNDTKGNSIAPQTGSTNSGLKIGLPLAIVVVVIATLLLILVFRRRIRNRKQATETEARTPEVGHRVADDVVRNARQQPSSVTCLDDTEIVDNELYSVTSPGDTEIVDNELYSSCQ